MGRKVARAGEFSRQEEADRPRRQVSVRLLRHDLRGARKGGHTNLRKYTDALREVEGSRRLPQAEASPMSETSPSSATPGIATRTVVAMTSSLTSPSSRPSSLTGPSASFTSGLWREAPDHEHATSEQKAQCTGQALELRASERQGRRTGADRRAVRGIRQSLVGVQWLASVALRLLLQQV